MNIIHFADLHIGVENYGRTDPQSGLSTRLQDFLAAFDELCDYALAWPADLVVFAGDAYKTREPSQTHQREFARRVRRLAAAGIPVFLLVGNHDLPNAFGRANALDIFSTLEVPYVYVGARIETATIATRTGPVQIVSVPWPNRSRLLLREDVRGLPVDQIERKIEEVLSREIAAQAEALDPALPALLTAHIAMHGSKVKNGSEQPMTIGSFPQLLPSTLDPARFDYVALGHHHIQQQVGTRPPMYYAGSMQRIDFGEEHDPKGFMAITLDPSPPAGERASDVRFVEVHARRFVTVEAIVRGDDPTAEVIAAIEKQPIRDAIVRVLIALTPQQNALLRDQDVQEALRPAHNVAAVMKTIAGEQRRRAFDGSESATMRPADALRRWLDLTDRPPDYRDELFARGTALIEAEDGAPSGDMEEAGAQPAE